MENKIIKICIIVPAHWEAVMGGSQYQAKMLVDYLMSKGKYEIYYLARRVPVQFVAEGYQIKQIAEPKGIRRFGEFLDTFDLLKLLNQISPDVIYQRVGCGYTGIASYYAKKHNRRCIWHVAHDREVMPFDVSFTRNIAFRYLEKKYLEYGVRNAGKIITQTQQQADLLWKYYKRKQDAIIPNVHPLPQENIVKSSPIKVVWVANLKIWKRPEIFIQLARDLAYMKDVDFIMIGKEVGDRSWCNKIKSNIDKLGNLNYLGGQSQEIVNQTLSSAHIFVNTSKQEGFANTFIQSWFRKVPVLSLSVNPDGVLGTNDIGVYAETYDNLKANLIRLIEDNNFRESMGERAQEYAYEQHTSKNFEALEDIIINK